jgi:uncharacterized XkdX family phage protein
MFERYKDRYGRGWATKEQLQRLVNLRLLTEEEYNLIVAD